MDNNLPVVCRACNRTVKMDQVKFDETRRSYVCITCFNSTHKTMPEIRRTNPSSLKTEAENLKSVKDSMVKYSCLGCKYHFSRKKDKQVASCPYCGSKKLQTLGDTANQILEDADRYDF